MRRTGKTVDLKKQSV